jgi:hypothetical protein
MEIAAAAMLTKSRSFAALRMTVLIYAMNFRDGRLAVRGETPACKTSA